MCSNWPLMCEYTLAQTCSHQARLQARAARADRAYAMAEEHLAARSSPCGSSRPLAALPRFRAGAPRRRRGDCLLRRLLRRRGQRSRTWGRSRVQDPCACPPGPPPLAAAAAAWLTRCGCRKVLVYCNPEQNTSTQGEGRAGHAHEDRMGAKRHPHLMKGGAGLKKRGSTKHTRALYSWCRTVSHKESMRVCTGAPQHADSEVNLERVLTRRLRKRGSMGPQVCLEAQTFALLPPRRLVES